MNKVYKVKKQGRDNSSQAVPETAKGHCSTVLKGLKSSALFGTLTVMSGVALALPQGMVVVDGKATSKVTGNTMTITQTTQNATANFQNFNIAKQETVNINQPNANAIFVADINNPSAIYGTLNATGNVILVSPGGLDMGGARINTGGSFTATTQEIAKGTYTVANTPAQAGAINLGTMTNPSHIFARNIQLNAASVSGSTVAQSMQAFDVSAQSSAFNQSHITAGTQLSITSENTTNVEASTLRAQDALILQANNAVNVKNSTIAAHDIAIGRDGFGMGALTKAASVSDSTLSGFNVETSGEQLTTSNLNVKALNEWLLDPTNVTIATGVIGGSTGGTLSSALANASAVTVSTADLQAAINAGTSVDIKASGSITQTGALSFTNSSGTAATLTLDNTLGSMQTITLAGITATGTSATHLKVISAGGAIVPTGAISVTGAVTLDNTYAVGGSTSGAITTANSSTLATASGMPILNPITAGTGITINYQTYNPTLTIGGVQGMALGLMGALSTSTGNVTMNIGAAGTAATIFETWLQASITATAGSVTVNSTLNGTTTGSGALVFTGKGDGSSGSMASYGEAAPVISAQQVALSATLQTLAASNANAYTQTAGAAVKVLNTASFSAANPNAITITSTLPTGSTGTGMSIAGAIVNNASGGNIIETTNGLINQTGAITVAANQNLASSITLDTTSGTKASSITAGAMTVATGSSQAVDVIEKSAGAVIKTGAITIPGSVTLDNTYASGGSVSGAINASNANTLATNSYGVQVTGAISAGSAITLNGVASGSSAVLVSANLSSSQLTSGNGISISGVNTTNDAVDQSGNLTFTSGTSSIVGGDINVLAKTLANGYTGMYNITSGVTAMTANGANINVGTAANPIEGGRAMNAIFGTLTATTVNNVGGNVNIYGKSNGAYTVENLTNPIIASGSVTISGLVSGVATAVQDSSTISVGKNLSITGTLSAAGGNTGISLTGAITDTSNGGNISFVSNNSITQSAPITLAANTSGTASTVTYDTTTGTNASTISSGTFTATGSSTSAINYIQKTAGAAIAVAAISLPGYILLDNTYGGTSGTGGTPTSGFITSSNAGTLATSSNGIKVNGALTAGTLAGSTGITLNGVSTTGQAVNNSSAALISNSGGITVNAIGTTAGTVATLNGAMTLNNNGNLSVVAKEVAAGANVGISSTAVITDNVNGGNLSFSSNNNINQTGTISLVANTSSAASSVTYDTTTGNKNSTITSGGLSVANGSTQAIDYTEKSAGSTITIYAPVSVPGSITLDNSYLSGGTTSGAINASNVSTLSTSDHGIQINGALSAGNNLTINAVSSGANSGGSALMVSANLSSATTVSGGALSINAVTTADGVDGSTNVTLTSGSPALAGGDITILANGGTNAAGMYSSSGVFTFNAYGANINLGTAANPIYAGYAGVGVSGISNTIGNMTTTAVGGVAGNINVYGSDAGGYAGVVLANPINSAGSVTINGVSNSSNGILASTTINAVGAISLTGSTTSGSAINSSGLLSGSAINVSGTASTNVGTVVTLGAMTVNAGGGNITVNAKNFTSGGNTGISQSGAITDNAVGGNISFVSNNSINQSGAIALVANTGANASSVTFDTTSGTNASTITTGALTVGSGSSVGINFIEKSAGAGLTVSATAVPGYIDIDNSWGGSTPASGYITSSNYSTLATTSTNGITYNGALTGGTGVTLTGVTYSGNHGVYSSSTAPITALTGNITVSGLTNTGSGVWANSGGATFTTNTGNIVITGQQGAGNAAVNLNGVVTATLGSVTLTGKNNTGNYAVWDNSAINAYKDITITGTSTPGNGNSTVYSSGAINLTGVGSNLIVSATNSTAGGASGINLAGAISGANGSNLTFTSNNSILQSGAITLAANTSGTSATVTYDTTAGTKASSISSGALSTTAGSNTSINYIEKTAGGSIVTSAISMPGYILLDNTYGGTTPASGFITSANAATYATSTGVGVTINGNLTAGSYAGATGITVNGVTGAAGVQGIISYASLTANAGPVNLIGQSSSNGGWGIQMAGGNVTSTNAGISLIGVGGYGIALTGTSNLIAANTNGNINIQGTALSNSNYGVYLNYSGGTEYINAGGNLTVVGSTPTTGSWAIYGANPTLLGATGNIVLAGSGGTGILYSTGAIVSGGNMTVGGSTTSTLVNPNGVTNATGIPNVATVVVGSAATGASAGYGAFLQATSSYTFAAGNAYGYAAGTYSNMSAGKSIVINGTTNSSSGGYYGVYVNSNLTANSIEVTGTAAGTVTATYLTGGLTVNAGGGNISIVGNNSTAAGGNTGIYQAGNITDNANGSNISFVSNSVINQTGATTLVANTSGTSANVTFDTTTGTKASTINTGTVTTATGSTSAINFTEKSAGAALTVSSMSMPGYILLDNTYGGTTPASGFITASNVGTYATNSVGINVAGTLAVGSLAGTTGVTINGASNGSYGESDSYTINSPTSVNISGLSTTNTAVNQNGAITANSINVIGVDSDTSSTVVSLGSMTINAGGSTISVQGTNGTAGGGSNIGPSGNSGIYQSGAITDNSNGGNISFSSNSQINQNGLITLAANTSGNVQTISYNTTGGSTTPESTYNASVTLGGGITSAGNSSTSSQLVSIKANGVVQLPAAITNNGATGTTGPLNLSAQSFYSGGNLGTNIQSSSTITTKGGYVVFDGTGGTISGSTITPGSIANGSIGTQNTTINTTGGAVGSGNISFAGSSAMSGSTAGMTTYSAWEPITTTINAGGSFNGQFVTSNAASFGYVVAGYASTSPITAYGNINITSTSTSTGLAQAPIYISSPFNSTNGSINLSSTSSNTSQSAVTIVSPITAATGVSITGTATNVLSNIAGGTVTATATITNGSTGGINITATGNLSLAKVVNAGADGMSLTGGYSIAAGVTSGGAITALGTLTNTDGVISASTSQPTSTTGGAIESALGITTANASVSSNVAYSQVGGVMAAPNKATVNNINYRVAVTPEIINLTTGSYSQVYGTAYNSTVANAWIENSANTTITSITSGSFGANSTTAQALASLQFNSTVGSTAKNANLVQSATSLIGTTSVTSSYGTVNVTAGTYTITPKTLTISTSDSGVTYNGISTYNAYSDLNYSALGLVTNFVAASGATTATGDAVSSVVHSIKTGTTIGSGTAIIGTAIGQAGSYNDVLSGAAGSGLSNYAISYVGGTYTIAKAPLTVTQSSNATVGYDGLVHTGLTSYNSTGLLGTDSITNLSTNTAPSGQNAGTYTGSLGGATGAGITNYNVTYVPATLTISPRAVTITGALTNVTYSGVAQTNAVATVTGMVSGQSLVINGYASSTNVGTFNDALSYAAGTGTSLANYTITTTNGSLTIGKATLTLTGAATTSVYNGNLQTNTYSVAGYKGSDNANSIGLSVTGMATATHVTQGTVLDNLAASMTSGNYVLVTKNGKISLSSAPLTITGQTNSNSYNAQQQSNASASISGLKGTDGVTVSGVATGLHAGTYNDNLSVSATGATQLSDYSVQLSQGALTITPINLSPNVTVTANNRTYNASNVATGSVSLSGGVLSADASTLGISTTGLTFANGNAGTNKTVTANGLQLTGNSYGDYTLGSQTTATTTATITPASLTYNGAITTLGYNATQQSNTGATLTGTLYGTDSFNVTGVATRTNAGTTSDNLTVTASGATLASNYNISINNGSVTITPAVLTATLASTTKVYDGTTAVSTSPLAVNLNGLYSADASSITATTTSATYANANVGTGITLSVAPTGVSLVGNSFGNYVLSSATITGSGSITARPVTITGANTSVVYNAATQTNSGATITGLVSGQTLNITGYGAGRHVGTYNDSLAYTAGTGTNLSNYQITVTNGALTITPYTLGFSTAVVANSKTYDATTTATGSITLNGVLAADAGLVTATAGSYNFADANYGIGKTVTATGITLGGADAGNYSLPSTTGTTTANIYRAPLTVTAQNDAKFYSQTDAVGMSANGTTNTNSYNGVTYNGFVAGQTASVLGTTGITVGRTGISNAAVLGTNAYETAGTYTGALVPTGAANIGNYAITYVAGNYTIVAPGQLLIRTAGSSSVYASANAGVLPSSAITSVAYATSGSAVINFLTQQSSTTDVGGVVHYTYVDGLGNTITFNTSTVNPTYSGSNNINVGSYGIAGTITASTGASMPSTIAVTGNTTITPLVTTIAAQATTNQYSATSQTQNIISGVVNGDHAVISGVATGTNVGTYSSHLAVSGTDISNYQFTLTDANLTITPASLTVTGISGVGRIYNGTNVVAVTGGSLLGVLGSDAANLVLTAPTTATMATKNVGTNAVTLATQSLSGSASNNYTLTSQASTTATITPANLSLNAVTDSKVYDGTTTSSKTVSVVGLQNGDTVTGLTQSFGSKNVLGSNASTLSVNTGYAVNDGNGGNNYTLTTTTATGTITPLAVTVAATTDSRAYNGTTASSALPTITHGAAVTGDTITLNGQTFASSNVLGTNGSTLNANAVTINDGNNGHNYAMTYISASGTITPVTLTITGTSSSVTYNATTQTNTAATVTGYIGSDTASSVGLNITGYASSKNAGTYADVLSDTVNDANYVTTIANNGTLTIGKAQLTVAGVTANSKVYDTTNAATLNMSNAVLGGVFGSDSANVSLLASSATGNFASVHVGNGIAVTPTGLVLTGSAASNYTLTQPTGLTGNITPATLTVSGITAANKVYDATTAATITTSGAVIHGLLGSDTLGLDTTNAAGTFATSHVGGNIAVTISNVSLTGNATTLSDYVISNVPIATTANITPATLTITGQTNSNSYNAQQQSNASASISGLKGTDGVTVSGVATGLHAGTYNDNLSVSATGATQLSDYSVQLSQGALTITPINLSPNVTVTANNRTYNASNVATGSVSLSGGVLSADASTLGISTTGLTFANGNAGTNKTVTANGLQLTGNSYGDYTLGSQTTATTTATITPASLTYNGAITTLGYNATQQSNTGATLTGTLYGTDSFNVTGVATRTNAGTTSDNLTVTASGATLASNYNISINNGSVTITPAVLTATLASTTKVYDGTTAVSTSPLAVNLNGLYSADASSITATTTSATYANANVGTGITLSVAPTGVSLVGNSFGNYVLSSATITGSGSITARPVTITGANTSVVYNAATQTNSGATITGLVSGQTLNITGYGAGRHVGTYNDSLAYTAGTGTNLSNYQITVTNGALTITPYTLGFSTAVVANSKTYDATTTATGSITLNGVLAADAGLVTATAGSYNFADANYGIGKTVTATGITLGGADAGNYSLPSTTGTTTANIYRAPLTVTAQNDAKFYSQTDAVGMSANGTTNTNSYNGVTYNGFVAGQTASVLGTTGITVGRTGISNAAVLGTNAYETAGTYTGALVPTGAANIGNYAITYVAGNYTIVPAGELLVRTSGGSSVYAGANAGVLPSGAVSSVAYATSGNTLTINNLTQTSQQTNATTGVVTYTYQDALGSSVSFNLTTAATSYSGSNNINVGSYGVAAAITASTGSSMPSIIVATGNSTITPLAMSLSAVATSSQYSAGVQSQSLNSSIIFGDNVTVSGLATGTHVGTYSSNLSVSGADVNNYQFTLNNANLTITPAPLYVTGITGVGRSYNGSTIVSVTGGVLNGVLGNDAANLTLSTPATGTMNTKNVGTNSVALTPQILGGSESGDYTLTSQASTTATITKANLVISAVTDAKVYDGTTYSVMLPASSNLQNGDTISNLGESFASKNVLGANNSTLTINSGYTINDGNGGNNYNVMTQTAKGSITPLAITVSAATDSRVYNNTTNSTGTPTITNGAVEIGDSVIMNGQTFASKNVLGLDRSTLNANPITVNDGNNGGNYAVTYVSAAGTITGATLTITGASTSSVYSAQTQTNSYKVSGLLGSDTVTSVAGNAAGLHVGTYVDTLNNAQGSGLSNYVINYVDGNLTITSAQLVASVNVGSKTYNGNTALSASTTLNGLLGNDKLTGVTVVNADNKNAGSANVIVGATALSGANTSDYTIVNQLLSGAASGSGNGINGGTGGNGSNGGNSGYTVLITPANLTITGGALTSVYNATNESNTYIVSGLVAGDSVSSVSGSAHGLHVGTYNDALTNAQGVGLSNYTISYVNGHLTITPAALNAAITIASKTYDGTTNLSSTTTLSGVYAGDTVAGTAHLQLSNSGAGVENIINNGVTLSGANASDYNLVSAVISGNNETKNSAGDSTIVARANAVITLNNLTTTHVGAFYGGNGYVVSGLVGGDIASSAVAGTIMYGGSSQGAAATGTYVITGSGLSSANYNLTYVNGTLSFTYILPLPPIVTPEMSNWQHIEEWEQMTLFPHHSWTNNQSKLRLNAENVNVAN